MSGYIIAGLTSIYVLLFLFFIVGLAKTRRYKGVKATPSVSVVVPMRNEEQYALRTLQALAAQDYVGEWEVICVDDRSTDSTKEILEKFAAEHPRFRVLSLAQNLPTIASPKKRALESAFKIAKNEVLLTIDADCIPKKSWITAMAGRFVGNISIVQGPKQNNGSRSMAHLFQKLETLGYTAMEAAGFSLGNPLVASAACLAYKKELFFKAGGFGDLVNLSSGDDDMLIHKMMKIPNVDVCYNLDKDAVIETEPVNSWKALFNQRARWSSNGTNYESKAYVLLLTLIYTFYVWMFISPWLVAFLEIPWQWCVFSILSKVAVDFTFLSMAAYKLHTKRRMLAFIPTELIQIPMIVFAVPAGITGLFRWK
ncbi:MAG: glycosyltransferase [Fibrobacteraceae bacterium]|nr:glycosyltransferase [Fibrobacteraceae bacterium]